MLFIKLGIIGKSIYFYFGLLFCLLIEISKRKTLTSGTMHFSSSTSAMRDFITVIRNDLQELLFLGFSQLYMILLEDKTRK